MSRSCDAKSVAFHRHRARVILKKAYKSEPSRAEIEAYQAHKLCIRDEQIREQLSDLRKRLKAKLEREQFRAEITPFPGPHGTWWAIPAYIVACESGYDYTPNYGLSFGGAYGLLVSTWHQYGGGRWASQANYAPPYAQDIVAHKVWVSVGPGAWACA